MARRRGFFAEMAHQAAVAEKNRQRAQAVAVRAQAQRQREAERAQRQYEQALRAAERADSRAAAQLQREMKQAHIAAQEAEVERLNGELALQLSDIDNVLAATLEVDDHVDLETLRRVAEHPPSTSQHSTPIPAPAPIAVPAEPVFVAPEPPRGMSAVFGKKKHAEAVAAAQAAHAEAHAAWQQAAAAVPMQQLKQLSEHQQAEQAREVRLSADRARYDTECAARQVEVDESNAALDQLISGLQAGTPEAVEEYLGIVFGNSVYPAEWPWPPAHRHDADTGELTVDLRFPAPDDLPSTRAYKYVRASDEITTTAQTQKEQKDRYAALVANMTLRTLHEVWEADRGGKVTSISLTGSVAHVDPATGKDTATPLIAVAVDRATFEDIDLSRVAPAETLRHLGAVVSKNPWALMPITMSAGVRAH
jgi:restriction system protein